MAKTLQERAQAWLDAPVEKKNYMEGVSILVETNSNKALMRNLLNKDTLQNRDKVNYLLSRYLNVDYKPLPGTQQPDPQLAPSVEEKSETVVLELKAEDEAKLEDEQFVAGFPVEVQQLIQMKKDGFNERNKLSQKITDITDEVVEGQVLPGEVEALTKEVLDIDEDIKAIDSKLAYFFQNGTLPIAKAKELQLGEMEAETLESIEKKIKNKKSLVSKKKKEAELNPDNHDKQQVFAMHELELKDLIFQRDTMKQAAVVSSTKPAE
jgi:hypothetical protein